MPNKGCRVRSSDFRTWRVYSILALSSQKISQPNPHLFHCSFFFFFCQLWYRTLYKVSFPLLPGVGHHVLATPMLTCRWCQCSLEGSGLSSLSFGCSFHSDFFFSLCHWCVCFESNSDPCDYSFCLCLLLLLSQCDMEHLWIGAQKKNRTLWLTHLTPLLFLQ